MSSFCGAQFNLNTFEGKYKILRRHSIEFLKTVYQVAAHDHVKCQSAFVLVVWFIAGDSVQAD